MSRVLSRFHASTSLARNVLTPHWFTAVHAGAPLVVAVTRATGRHGVSRAQPTLASSNASTPTTSNVRRRNVRRTACPGVTLRVLGRWLLAEHVSFAWLGDYNNGTRR